MYKPYDIADHPYAHEIASPDLPFPGIATQINASGVQRELRALERDVTVHSNRPKEEVMGILMREMPAPCMLETLHEVLKLTKPDNKNKLVYLRSDPGIGKSYFAKTIGRLIDARGAVFADLGGKDMGQLLSRTVTDNEQQALSLEQQIEQALDREELRPASIAALHKLGKHFDGKRIDWHSLKSDPSISGRDLHTALETVRNNQGWGAKSGLGFKVIDGALVQADREGRPVILDEFEKRKSGSENALQVLWQVFNGEVSGHTVPLANGETHDFKTNKNGAYRNLVILTANYQADGSASIPDSESFLSRARVLDLEKFQAIDWQHRICQLLTGMPVSTLYYINKTKWDGDPKAFTKYLMEYRRMGLTPEQQRSIPASELTLLANWPQVIQASQSLAKLYSEWGELVDPESHLHQKGQESGVLGEIEDGRVPTKKVTPRRASEHIFQALAGPSESFGTRLSEAVIKDIAMTTQGRPKLYRKLYDLASLCGMASENPTFAPILNLAPVKGLAPTETEAASAGLQRVLAAHLKASNPTLSSDPERVLPLAMVDKAVKNVGKNWQKRKSNSANLIVPNDDTGTAREAPLRMVTCETPANASLESIRGQTKPEQLLPINTLLAALALPHFGEVNLEGLWNDNVNGSPISAVDIARNHSGTGLGTTSLLCSSKAGGAGTYSRLHVVRNERQNSTLIVGNQPISAELQKSLNAEGITYINQKLPDALASMERALGRMAPNELDQEKLRAAFALRNRMEEKSAGLSFAAILADPTQSELMAPTLVRAPMERAHAR